VPDGTKYVPLKDIVLKDAFDEYLARIVCFCFSISPQPFVSQTNRATAETAKAQATEEGLGPVLNWLKRLIDQIVQRHLGFAGLEFVWIDDREMDPSAADAIDVADVKAGIRTINEVRMARGLDPLPGGDKLMVATGTGYVPVTQDAAPTPQTNAPRQRPQSAFGKFNPNHWPGGSPDNEGGGFAPKDEGGTELASDSSPTVRLGQGIVRETKPSPRSFQMSPDAREALLEQEVTGHAGTVRVEKGAPVMVPNENNQSIPLTDETGATISGPAYTVPDGSQDGRLIVIVNAYSAADGGGNGVVSGMKFFSTRAALNDFLAKNSDWQEKYGNSNTLPAANTTYLFAGAVNPGWENGTSGPPTFILDGEKKQIALTQRQLANAVYWHEWSHFPPTSYPGSDEGENQAWEYGLKKAGVDF